MPFTAASPVIPPPTIRYFISRAPSLDRFVYFRLQQMDELQAVGVPELRGALRLVRGRRRPVSADELAAAQSVHRNVARRRLDRLFDAGLLVRRQERRSGRTGPGAGRPAHVYAPAPE